MFLPCGECILCNKIINFCSCQCRWHRHEQIKIQQIHKVESHFGSIFSHSVTCICSFFLHSVCQYMDSSCNLSLFPFSFSRCISYSWRIHRIPLRMWINLNMKCCEHWLVYCILYFCVWVTFSFSLFPFVCWQHWYHIPLTLWLYPVNELT